MAALIRVLWEEIRFSSSIVSFLIFVSLDVKTTSNHHAQDMSQKIKADQSDKHMVFGTYSLKSFCE